MYLFLLYSPCSLFIFPNLFCAIFYSFHQLLITYVRAFRPLSFILFPQFCFSFHLSIRTCFPSFHSEAPSDSLEKKNVYIHIHIYVMIFAGVLFLKSIFRRSSFSFHPPTRTRPLFLELLCAHACACVRLVGRR